MLTARPGPAGSGSLAPLPSAELRIPPQAERRCDQAPAPAIDAPYDAAAARSYAIQLLPSFLGTDAAPWLGALLAGPDEQDRFSALQAIACLASDEAGTSSALLEHVQERYDRELRRLAVRGPLVPPGFEPVPAELWSEALSSDFGRSSDALDDLLERAPASHPILHTLLAEGSPGDRRIAEHFASHPDPRAVSPLLLALGRSPTHAERSEAIIAALQACVPRGRLHPRPPVLQSVEAWQSWGAVWQRRRTLIGGARALTALLPLLLLIGLGLKESRWSGRPTQGLAPGGERG